ncbi:Cytochrome P450 [Bradyrhizobium brasilense]|uniref:Cytochrome P450 n=1 Tax=Bradyrhizobium brasilense TaxID=1419277 RepID=A0A1G6U2X8_9BRAD|nr:cytochrome P450 [Bradyrhizobium brasilense]SDD35750.1 Cytochrome P450 [Bradyrhizobium brasilense]
MTTLPLSDARRSEPIRLPADREWLAPSSELDNLRKTQPLSRFRFPDGRVGWFVTSQELARVVLGDARFTRLGAQNVPPESFAAHIFHAIHQDPEFPDALRALVDRYRSDGRLADAFRDPGILRTVRECPMSSLPFFLKDAPDHTRIRRTLAGYFTVRQAGEYRARITRIVADCLDAMQRRGPPVDLVEAFALAVPTLVACEMFGVPTSDRELFIQFTVRSTHANATMEDILKVQEEFRAFISRIFARKRLQPTDDIFSELARSGNLTDEELLATSHTLLSAAHTAIARTMTFSVYTLLKDRDLWNALRKKPESIGVIVEELLRNTVAGFFGARMALEDVDLGGTVIKAFETVFVSFTAANRDPQVFVEPDRVDLNRQEASKHLTFSYGIHQCLGQHFARLELQIMLTELADRFPNLDFAVPIEDMHWHTDREVYAPQTLPVTW